MKRELDSGYQLGIHIECLIQKMFYLECFEEKEEEEQETKLIRVCFILKKKKR